MSVRVLVPQVSYTYHWWIIVAEIEGSEVVYGYDYSFTSTPFFFLNVVILSLGWKTNTITVKSSATGFSPQRECLQYLLDLRKGPFDF